MFITVYYIPVPNTVLSGFERMNSVCSNTILVQSLDLGRVGKMSIPLTPASLNYYQVVMCLLSSPKDWELSWERWCQSFDYVKSVFKKNLKEGTLRTEFGRRRSGRSEQHSLEKHIRNVSISFHVFRVNKSSYVKVCVGTLVVGPVSCLVMILGLRGMRVEGQ